MEERDNKMRTPKDKAEKIVRDFYATTKKLLAKTNGEIKNGM